MPILTLDFETRPILQRPEYPPAPVGVAIWPDLGHPVYMSFGHINGRNNSSEAEAKERVWSYWCDPTVQILCHNAKFDLAVATERWGFPMLPWHRIHDTMFLAFLDDPHSRSAGLKELAQALLGMPPEEQDQVKAWILANKTRLEPAFPLYPKVTPKQAGAWIFAAPAELVEPYALGDVVRTRKLFDHLMPSILARRMDTAYNRERKLLPILMENEKRGMRLDPVIVEDIERYTVAFDHAEEQLRTHLNASGLNFDADQDVASVLIQQGIVPESYFARTAATKTNPNGQLSVAKDNLLREHFVGPHGDAIFLALGYRNRLKTCLDMFMRPWAAQGRANGGYITTNWNQIRSNSDTGTRTGRPSTNNFNFLNLSKDFAGRDDGYEHPAFLGVPELPLVRRYVLPDDGELFLHRDFSGQEMRVFAHFEQGDLFDKYQEDATLDPHSFVGAELMRVAGREIERTKVKALNFQGMYGGGAPALQRKLRISMADAKELKRFHNEALPGRVILNDEITRVIRRNDPVRTWGGREYYAEHPDEDGRSKIYKLINYLIQGSAADLTKQAIIDWHEDDRKNARFLVTVYDEINASAPVESAVEQMAVLQQNMEAPRLTVPMLSDGKWGWAWGKVTKYNDQQPGEVP